LIFFLSRGEFAPIGRKEHYLVDLIGFRVLDENQTSMGTVIDVLIMPTQNIIVVETKGNEILIPYVDAYVTFFDKKKKNLIVKDVVGLID